MHRCRCVQEPRKNGRNGARAAQLLRRLDREVGEDAVRARALEAVQAFHHRLVIVQPAILSGRLDHGVLAADLIGEGRHPERLLHPMQHIEIGHAGLHHQHVRALGDIQRAFADRLVAVAEIHLIGALVALEGR